MINKIYVYLMSILQSDWLTVSIEYFTNCTFLDLMVIRFHEQLIAYEMGMLVICVEVKGQVHLL